ncbi:hypothetical protein [Hirschia litorea]|uniref:Nucleotidyl transferase AbiEii toxin, Type IV TA system n=1 Tax=Hirschia litorea TaxID=1199156 RepID=A0ABW2IPS8_9PROT
MTNHNPQLIEMVTQVATALGDDLLQKTVFVGGATTGLFVTDDFALSQVRLTDDVDLIVDVIGYGQWANLQALLRTKGFKESTDSDVICRMVLNGLNVDFMPDDEKVLGFSNRWYALGLKSAEAYQLDAELSIRILTPSLFIATKLEAYLGRGADDLVMSHDLEDILVVLDGRKELMGEIQNAPTEIREYISTQFQKLLAHDQFRDAVEGNMRGNTDRTKLVYERMRKVIETSN